MTKNITLLFASTTVALVSQFSFADLDEPYISERVCPFEGCSYGEWDVQKETNIYSKPNKDSEIIGTLNSGESVTALTGNVYVYAGIAKITGNPYKESKGLNPDELVYILDYVVEAEPEFTKMRSST